ncbi:MAG: hypothetical protein GY779_06500, partial [Gammaproteobacteria bacterium]|nr:hypothetical protein [Gammaproteobacteria bacterium]
MFSTNASVAEGSPTFSVAFSPSTIGPGSTTTLTYTMVNSEMEVGASNLSFSNSLPNGMTIASTPDCFTDCQNANYSADAGSDTITFDNARLGADSTCTLSLNVISATAGTNTNTTGDLTSSLGNSGNAQADLIVDATRAGFSAEFSPSSITPGATSTLIYTIDNTHNASELTYLKFTNTLPTGLTVSQNPNVTFDCSNTTIAITAEPGSDQILASLFTVAASESCDIKVNVTAAATGSYINTTSELSRNNSLPSGIAVATLDVENPFMYASFPTSASPGQSVELTFTMTNLDRNNDATNISFSDDLNATLSGLEATALPADGFCGPGSTMTGSSNLTVSGGNLTAGGSCTFSVTVLVPANAAAGTYTNTTSTINLTQGSTTTKPAITNTLTVVKAPTITAIFIDDPAVAGTDVTLRYVITNTDPVNGLSAITFTENINDIAAGTSIKTLPDANDCGTGSSFLSTSSNGELFTFKLQNGTIEAGDSCTFDVILSTSDSLTPGDYLFSTSLVSATLNGMTVYGNATTDTLTIAAAPALSLAITESTTVPGSSVTATFNLAYSNNATADATDIGFTVDLEDALTGLVSASAEQSDICGTGSILKGTSPLTFTGGSLSPGDECSFSVTLNIPGGTAPGSITLISSAVSATTGGLAVTSATASDDLLISGLELSQAFIPDTLLPGSSGTLRYTISNAANVPAATAMVFTNSLSSTLSSLAATSLPNTPCGDSSVVTGSTYLTFSGGSLEPGENCTFDILISIPAGAAENTYVNTTSSMSATVNGNNTESPAASAVFTIESLSVLLSTTAGASTSDSPIPVAIHFSRAVTNFVAADLTIGNGIADNFSGSGQSYTVDIIPTADGTVTIDLPANTVDDAVDGTHKNPAATQLSIEYTANPAVATPSIIISAPSLTETNSGPVTYTVTYTDTTEINLTQSAIILNGTGTNASITVTGGDTATATVTLSNITGDGTLGFSIAADTARNSTESAPAAGPSATFSIDNTKPTVVISDSVNPDVNGPFTATITFSEAITGFSQSDISVAKAGLSDFTVISSLVYTVLVTPTTEGDVTLDISSNVAVDSVDNGNSAALQHLVNYDLTKPTVVISGDAGPIKDPATVTFTFDEDISGFSQGDISVSNATLSAFTASSAAIYTILVTPVNDGAVTVDVAGGVGFDAAGNGNSAASQYSVIYDSTVPTVVISSDSTSVNSSFTATFTFSEGVTGFTIDDIESSNGTLDNFITGSSTVYTVDVTPVSEGVVVVNVQAGVAIDQAGNANNEAATPLNVTYDITE